MQKNISFFTHFTTRLLAVLLIFSAVFGGLDPALAVKYEKPPVTDTRYRASFISQSIPDPVEIIAGETKRVTVTMKNTGTTGWSATGKAFVSVYTIAPKYRDSMFRAKSWLRGDQPTVLTTVTKPGATAKLVIDLTAPTKAGEYTEYFSLAAEDTTWIQGGTFYFKIKVMPAKQVGTLPTTVAASEASSTPESSPAPVQASVGSTPVPAGALAAVIENTSPSQIEAAGGTQLTVNLELVNKGISAWDGYEWREALTRPLTTSTIGLPLDVADTTWQTGTVVLSLDTRVEPEAKLPLSFMFRAPVKKGKYLVRFALRTGGQAVPGAVLEIPVLVNEDAPENYQPVSFVPTRTLVSKPDIRVGLYTTQKPVVVKSTSEYQVFGGSVAEGVLPAGEEGELSYKSGTYYFSGGSISFESKDPIRLVPIDPEAFFTLVNYDRRYSSRKANFNTYRGTVELAYAPNSKAVYVINELPLDQYVAGVAETSNDSALEYMLAQTIAERSYAYYKRTYARAGKKAIFDVVPTTADQLYLGYAAEIASPRVAFAAYATAGQLVTYKGAPVVTPYFSRTDGRTRSWTEVWGGAAKPWLVSVPAVHDVGKVKAGHGVGMSGADASRRAQLDKWKYDQILRYYYSGTEVEKIY